MSDEKPTVNWGLVGERLHLARRRLGMKSVDLATRAHTNRTTVSRLEHGRHPEVSFNVLWRVAQTLGVSLDWLTRAREE
jgi:transcriptional regulator with XRE-family HTH domain